MTPSPPANSKQVATAGLVVPHPEKVTPNSKARIHRDFGYGGEDSFYCAWGPRCVLKELPHCLYQACMLCGIACCCGRSQGVVAHQQVAP